MDSQHGMKQIVEAWDKGFRELADRIDFQVRNRIIELKERLKRFEFEGLLCGMGTWTVNGPDFTAVDEDDDDDETQCEIFKLFEFCVTPKGLTTDELQALTEFNELCNWWIDTTGGADVDFQPSEDDDAS